MYVAVKGGERAIDNAHAWLAEERRGDRRSRNCLSRRSGSS
jgi:alpha-D-ribose 1-methylphosphonate 5-triphosphate synthase subunit PhnI